MPIFDIVDDVARRLNRSPKRPLTGDIHHIRPRGDAQRREKEYREREFRKG